MTSSRSHIDNSAQDTFGSLTDGNTYKQADGNDVYDATNGAMEAEANLFNDSPLDWDQWDALLQEFQDYNDNDMNMLFPPPLL